MKKIAPLILLFPLFSFLIRKEKQVPALSRHFLENKMIYFPQGSVHLPGVNAEGKSTKTVSVSSFYMYPYEVSNMLYRVFAYDVGLTDFSLYEKILPDTLVWRHKLAYNEPYVEYYYRHPAYRDYPMVGISHEQCELFCKWLTEKYNADPDRKFKKVIFNLPTKNQWYYAAAESLSDDNGKKNVIPPARLFPWSGPYLRNGKGLILANFKEIDQATIKGENATDNNFIRNADYGVAGTLNDNADVTAPVNAYLPNEAGLYNMAGNVEEFVREKGITKGGSWNDTGFYLRNDVEEKYDSTNSVSSSRGFRFVMEVVEAK
ncbi:MAG: SUMF1/EgtB/PvdO family nonheme iron enzyme [Bacteroidia bacterium]|nr:SUMF1/EgtB/PvdO family nonheme iron enzyme [Bacteroidia bacterium]